jgi:ATP-dependent helicase HrpA
MHNSSFTISAGLPIAEHAAAITEALRQNQVLIVCGDTGSGKTTQLPKIALNAGRGRQGLIGCTQPRRLAALAMARRVAEECGEEPGGFVGYQHRFDKKLSSRTVVKFMTDGILLAETRRDRLFKAYDTLIIDEAHERSLNIDFLLGLLKRILPRRPNLKLIISSATLDVGKFSDFFNNAPIITVPGRVYPIETRWRPPDDDDDPDLPHQIANAVDELIAQGPGDILVFLPGERDIREAAETLQGRFSSTTEIIPLLASLPASEQQRAFRLSSRRRVILSTNVAETSVTLPGIRYVIDSGLVRLRRYNPRTRVQRLQIEPVSQASADQRKGRCGRIAPGICIRLYDPADFKKRAEFTPPEILRSGLAGVILTMLDLRLGKIEEFPFIDPPSNATIREGYRELVTLGAIKPAPDGQAQTQHFINALTPIGRQLARLPLEPSLGRILLAAHDEKAMSEALTVVAALECDDPRRRPIEKQAEADRLHARFLTPASDFAAIIRLWRWYHDQTAGASRAAVRRLCKENFLSYPRMRDWIDLREQLSRIAKEMGFDTASSAGGDTGLHRALLAGLLDNIGQRDTETNDYRGLRDLRFAIFPGSGLAKTEKKKTDHSAKGRQPRSGPKPPSRNWIMAGELVETSRLFARTAACIEPEWIEPLAAPLCKYNYHAIAWDGRRGFVRAKERVTFFGLVIVSARSRDYSRINPAEARAIFIREGLINGDYPPPLPPFFAANLARIRALLAAEAKTRRHGTLFDPNLAYAFYDARIPEPVCSAAALRQWLKTLTAAETDALVMSDADLPPARDLKLDFPDSVTLNNVSLPLTYRHAPGEPDDGITCTVPDSLLPLAATWRSEWLVPGMLDEKLLWMLNVLPSRLRRLLQPFNDTIAMCRSRLQPGHGALAEAFAAALYDARGVRVPYDAWAGTVAPEHLRVRFTVTDAQDRTLGSSRDLDALLRRFGKQASEPSPQATQPWHRDNITQWDFGTLPAQVDVGRAGWPIIHYPALADNLSSVALRLFNDPADAAASHEKGVLRLFALTLGKEWRRLSQPPSLPRAALLYLKQIETNAQALGAELGLSTLREVLTLGQPAIRDAATFRQRLEKGQAALAQTHLERTRLTAAILCAASEIESLLAQAHLPQPALDDITEQLAWLIFPGFVEAAASATLRNMPRYLEACRIRIQRAPANPAGDLRKLEELSPLWQRYLEHVTLDAPPPHDRALLAEYRWMIEEFRVSLFAQELRTPAPVSAKRLNALWSRVFS